MVLLLTHAINQLIYIYDTVLQRPIFGKNKGMILRPHRALSSLMCQGVILKKLSNEFLYISKT